MSLQLLKKSKYKNAQLNSTSKLFASLNAHILVDPEPLKILQYVANSRTTYFSLTFLLCVLYDSPKQDQLAQHCY
jgi:hypothetical protein